MLDSSFRPTDVRDFVILVSQSGLTHEAGLVFGGLLFMEFLMNIVGVPVNRWLRWQWQWRLARKEEERMGAADMAAMG